MFGVKSLAALGLLSATAALGIAGYRADIPYSQVRIAYQTEASRFTQVSGATLHYTDQGTGEPLILLHGSGAEQGAYAALGMALTDKGYRVIALDLPGSGLSLAGPDTGFHNRDNTALLIAFLAKIGVQPKAIIGHSTGGQIAWTLGIDAPQVADKLVLLAPTGLPTPSPLTWKIAQTPVLGPMLKNVTPEFIVRENLKDAVFDETKITDAQVTRYHDLLLRDGARDALFARMNAISFERADELSCLTLPTLLIWGEEDIWLPLPLASEFQAQIPAADLITLPLTGHNLPEEADPAALAAHITDWLQRQTKPATSGAAPCPHALASN
ncbi:alpha/beta fold hydrolase [Pacificoceanicola onchidii]|uniref:alpha/beta fold hydrolase n=1 Tax=Pacificoceanicola onchidii TaxID=2562685 RepID=UPI0010A5E984|nr:alpha/beta hydrolase [Pacificoceanicola onchidii]